MSSALLIHLLVGGRARSGSSLSQHPCRGHLIADKTMKAGISLHGSALQSAEHSEMS